MKTINLLLLGQTPSSIEWQLGKVISTYPTPQAIRKTLEKTMVDDTADAWLFWEPSLGIPDADLMLRLLDSPADVWHAGLKLGLGGTPELLKYVAATWMFIVDPPKDIEAVSWRVSLNCCLVRTEILKSLGLPLPSYKELNGAGLELGFRYLRLGAIIKHNPELVPRAAVNQSDLNFEDQVRFISDVYGQKWVQWCLIHTFLRKPLSVVKVILAKRNWPQQTILEPDIRTIPVENPSKSISVVLPTLNRYDYLPGCLESIRKQTVKPTEIIVVDQNPPHQRRPDIYVSFNDLPIKVIWQEETGQCKARNAAVLASSGEWLFFADDDSIYPPDAIERHWSAVQYFNCAGSSGLSLPPREYIIPREYRHFRIAYNLDTGNCLVKRSVVLMAGGFDLHYDYGKGADQDLGMRIYLHGEMIIHNPTAQRIHFKGAGGLRMFGVLWNNRSVGREKTRPPVSTVYYFLRYAPTSIVQHAIIQTIFLANTPSSQITKNRYLRVIFAIGKELFLLPKTYMQAKRSYQIASEMIHEGPRLLAS